MAVSGTVVNEDLVQRFAKAIANAEGFNVPNSRPSRNHNPGDLTLSLGYPFVGMDGIYIVFGNDDAGWGALRAQVRAMLTNSSHVYNNSMSIIEVASKYTTTDQGPWASIVADGLGVFPSTKLSELS